MSVSVETEGDNEHHPRDVDVDDAVPIDDNRIDIDDMEDQVSGVEDQLRKDDLESRLAGGSP